MTRLLRLPDVLARVPVSTSVLYASIRAKAFPAPVKLGSASMWPEDEIDAWVEAMKAARPDQASPPTSA